MISLEALDRLESYLNFNTTYEIKLDEEVECMFFLPNGEAISNFDVIKFYTTVIRNDLLKLQELEMENENGRR